MDRQQDEKITTMPVNKVIKDMNDYEQKYFAKKKKKRLTILVITLIVLAIIAGVLLIISRVKFSSFETTNVLDEQSYDADFCLFADGFIRYSGSGISLFDTRFNAVWDEGLSMSDPQLAFAGDYGLIYDRGGNAAVLFDKNGKRTEIGSSLPINFACLSEYGMTAFGTSDAEASLINFYNIDGTRLDIEVKTVLSESSGYPIAMALSPSGTKLVLSLMSLSQGEIKSQIKVFDFEADRNVTDKVTGCFETDDAIFAEVTFISDDDFVAFGDNALAFYKIGGSAPELKAQVPVSEEIQSVLSGENYVGVITKVSTGGYRLMLYNKNGESTFERVFNYDYEYARISGNRVLIYGGDTNLIVSKSGAVKYEGSFTEKITDMLSLGFESYLQCGDFGMRIIRLK